ncbi:hypothetical protein CMI47_10025 [Candidatus Pacearchaeota archaeon]|jgi:hypothetical protein|nr:hypothetical protein [Candidatus Pacearchaeota archaeon]
MSASSNYLEDKLLDHVLNFGNGSLTVGTGRGYEPEATVYVALFADTGSGVAATLESNTSGTDTTAKFGYYEVNNGSYARQAITFANAGASTTGTISSNATVSFPVATADYDSAGSTGNVITHLALMDGNTTGADNCLFYGALTTNKTVSSGDQFTISSGNLSISLA